MLYTIGEMAKALGLPTSTLRFYERKGLLPFVGRSKGGVRMFTDRDYEVLQVIECLKQSGLSLNEIAVFIDLAQQGDATIEARLQIFRKRREEVEKQILAMEQTLETLNYKCWYYETAQAAGTAAVPEGLPPEQVPERFREIRRKLQSK